MELPGSFLAETTTSEGQGARLALLAAELSLALLEDGLADLALDPAFGCCCCQRVLHRRCGFSRGQPRKDR